MGCCGSKHEDDKSTKDSAKGKKKDSKKNQAVKGTTSKTSQKSGGGGGGKDVCECAGVAKPKVNRHKNCLKKMGCCGSKKAPDCTKCPKQPDGKKVKPAKNCPCAQKFKEAQAKKKKEEEEKKCIDKCKKKEKEKKD